MKYFLYILLIALISSCNDTLFDAGDVVKKKINIEDFSTLIIDDVFEIYLIQDSICGIEVEAAENLIPNINFDFHSDNELTITEDNKYNWSRNYDKIKLYISVNELRFLKVKTSCNVQTVNTLETLELRVWSIGDYAEMDISVNTSNFYFVNSASSGGHFTFKGETVNFGFWARGSSIIDASELLCVAASIESETIGDCQINVSGIISAKISRTGNIYYRGNPHTINYLTDRAKKQLIKID